MTGLSPLAPAGDWRPSPAELLAAAAGYHLREAQTDALEASRRLAAMASQQGLGADHVRRLHQLAAAAALAADGAQLLLAELAPA